MLHELAMHERVHLATMHISILLPDSYSSSSIKLSPAGLLLLL